MCWSMTFVNLLLSFGLFWISYGAYQVMGASGSGKTSLLRAIAGLWTSGSGTIRRYTLPICTENNGSISEVGKDVGNEGEEFGSESDNGVQMLLEEGAFFSFLRSLIWSLVRYASSCCIRHGMTPEQYKNHLMRKVLFFNSNLCFICIITCPLSSLFYPTRVIRYA